MTASVISWHLSRRRGIRDNHLAAYLRALRPADGRALLAAWLRDVAGSAIAKEVLDPHGNVVDAIRDWSPELAQEQRAMLQWWEERLGSADPDFDVMFRTLTRQFGFKP